MLNGSGTGSSAGGLRGGSTTIRAASVSQNIITVPWKRAASLTIRLKPIWPMEPVLLLPCSAHSHELTHATLDAGSGRSTGDAITNDATPGGIRIGHDDAPGLASRLGFAGQLLDAVQLTVQPACSGTMAAVRSAPSARPDSSPRVACPRKPRTHSNMERKFCHLRIE